MSVVIGNVQFGGTTAKVGFAQLSHLVTLDPRLSDGAKVTYLILLLHAQQKDWAVPGLARIGAMRQLKHTAITNHLKELEKYGFIKRNRRIGKSSRTVLRPLHKIYTPETIDFIKNLLYSRSMQGHYMTWEGLLKQAYGAP